MGDIERDAYNTLVSHGLQNRSPWELVERQIRRLANHHHSLRGSPGKAELDQYLDTQREKYKARYRDAMRTS